MVLSRTGAVSRDRDANQDVAGSYHVEMPGPPGSGLVIVVSYTRRDNYLLLDIDPLLESDRTCARGTFVGLYDAEGTASETCLIDEAQPRARFDQVPTNVDYTVRIQRGEMRFELALDLHA